jgi:hypothetical protein
MADKGTMWESPFDGHVHYSDQGRAECSVCGLVDKCDELTEECEEYSQLTDRLTRLLTQTANALKGDPGPLTLHDWSDLPVVAGDLRERLTEEQHINAQYGCPDCGVHAGCDKAVAERNRYREALQMIAIPPVHIPGLSEGCAGCAGVARAALDGTEFRGPISTTLEAAVGEAQLRSVVEVARELRDAEAAPYEPGKELTIGRLFARLATALDQLDVSGVMGVPERERIVHENPKLRASLERGMAQAAAGDLIDYRTDPAAWDRYMRSDAAQAEWDAETPSQLSDACALCGRDPATGYASIGASRYCHGDDERPSCYERANFANAFPGEPFPTEADDE